jgi:hypothetical protein
MERWKYDSKGNGNLKSCPRIDNFLSDLLALCRKHQLCIGHEDTHGSFMIHQLDENVTAWMNDADDSTAMKSQIRIRW